ncbi:hypothetical protein P43SY_008370 [Pythium insidiosum]|uniref:PUB domain-containing protein n=1 Tax=Pythium insidiosum TaxID=114742 RepID=A0AAD5LM51_PYTIN|nr:hypothetical protein P43SY_008370 [Pythium insidiosum]
MTEVTIVYKRQELYVTTATVDSGDGRASLAVELLQCQLLSLVGLAPEEQVLVTLDGRIVDEASSLSVGHRPLRLFLFERAETSTPATVPDDWHEICTRCTFGTTPVVQPAFRRVGDSQSADFICRACAQTCAPDYELVDPLSWRASSAVRSRFISDIVVIAGGPDVVAPKGYERVEGDLNYGASGDYVHLFVKRDIFMKDLQEILGSRTDSQKPTSAALRYLENLVKTPTDPKFHKIKASNKYFVSNISDILGPDSTLKFMEWCGFVLEQTGDDEFYRFSYVTSGSATTSLEAMRRRFFLAAVSS